MPAPVMQRSNFSDLFGSSQLPVLEYLFRSELDRHPSRREMLFNTRQTDRDIWQYSEIHDLDLFSEVSEGTEFSFKRPKQGANKTLTMTKFGLGFSISEEMVSDGKFDFIADSVRKLGKSARESQEISAMNIFNNGFSTETTADGVSVFNTAHTLPSGLTFRNRLSTNADLSVTSLDTALQDFETQFIGDSGIKYSISPKFLVVHPSNKRFAMELVGSTLKPETADNNMNAFLQDNLMVVSSPHLTDSDAWFLTSSPDNLDENGLVIVVREGIQTTAAGPDVGFTTDSIFYKAKYREKLAAVHPYGLFGSPGA